MKFGPQALSNFLDELVKWENDIITLLTKNLKIKSLNMRQQAEFDNAMGCYLYWHEFTKDDLKGLKVRDYDYITGEFIGAAHRECNFVWPVSF